jgi:Carboxypeptidase regulatory-like domain/Bacterial Ig-like domain (group 2)
MLGGLAVLALAACGSGSNLSTPAPAAPSPTPTVKAVAVSGAAPAVGETAQFTATATLSNGTEQDVTPQAVWQSSNAAVVSVSATGLVTAAGPGEADISATYSGLRVSQHVNLLPRTFMLTGTITDDSTAQGIDGEVEVLDGGNAGKTARADANGRYALGGLLAGAFTVRARATGYGSSDRRVTIANGDVAADFTLRRAAPPVGPASAAYDATLKAPACADPSSACDSGTLLNGRGPSERNQPNTVFGSCSDGQGTGSFVNVASIRVATLDGSALAAGKTVQISVAYSIFSSAGRLIVSHAPNAQSSTFAQIFRQNGANFGATADFSFTLPPGSVQVIRAAGVFDVSDDDCDDLVFRVQ